MTVLNFSLSLDFGQDFIHGLKTGGNELGRMNTLFPPYHLPFPGLYVLSLNMIVQFTHVVASVVNHLSSFLCNTPMYNYLTMYLFYCSQAFG